MSAQHNLTWKYQHYLESINALEISADKIFYRLSVNHQAISRFGHDRLLKRPPICL